MTDGMTDGQRDAQTRGHNFVKNKKIQNLKSHAHLQIMMKHSAKFQVNSIKDVAGVGGTRYE